MLVQSRIPSSVEGGKQDVCISVLKSYRLQKVSLDKSCAWGIGGFIQSCHLCGHSENVLNMLLCDRCEEAFHISCCRAVLPVDEWFCHRCSKITCSTKSRTISQGIGPCQFEFGPIAAMLMYPEPFTSKVRIGEAYQAQVPDWCVDTLLSLIPYIVSFHMVLNLTQASSCWALHLFS